MTFDRLGFLSRDLDQWREKVRNSLPQHYQACDALNELCQQAIGELGKLPSTKQNLLTCAFFIRTLHFFQGAILLTERGLVPASRTLLRSGFEALFFLGASIQDENFLTTLMKDHAHHQDKTLRMLRKVVSNYEHVEHIHAYIDDALREVASWKVEDPAPAGFEYVARVAKLERIYDTYYRGLSTDSAHANFMSIMDIFDFDEATGSRGIKYGPAQGDYKSTLQSIFCLGVNCVAQVSVLFQSDDIGLELDRQWKAFEVVVGPLELPDLPKRPFQAD